MAVFPRELLSMDVRCDRLAPAVVRESIAGVDALETVRGDALLVATEVITELVTHADCGADDWIQLRITELPRAIAISGRGPAASSGRARLQPVGMQTADTIRPLVFNALARRWGAEHDGGYHLWAEIPTG